MKSQAPVKTMTSKNNETMTAQRGPQTLLATLLVLGMVAILGLTDAAACSQCFGAGAENATTFGITMSMLGLLGFLGVVWGGVGLFVWRVRRRSKMLEPEDWVVTEDGDIEALND